MNSEHMPRVRKRRFFWLGIITAVCVVSISLTAIELHALQPQNFYVSNYGADTNSGTSPTTPWQHLANLVSHHFNPGDMIYLAQSSIFTEQLRLSGARNGNGSASASIVLEGAGYDDGHRTTNTGGQAQMLSSNSGAVLELHNVTGWTIDHLDVTTAWSTPFDPTFSGNVAVGVAMKISFTAHSGPYSKITISHDDFSGTNPTDQTVALQVGVDRCADVSTKTPEIASNLAFTDNLLHNVGIAGAIITACDGAFTGGGFRDVLFKNTSIYNTGDQGAVLGNINSGSITHNTAHDTGIWEGTAPTWTPSALWTIGSTRIDFGNNTAYHNAAANTSYDGCGFDIDWDTSYVDAHDNVAHDNLGCGIESLAGDHNTIRNNVFYNDQGLTASGAEIYLLDVDFDHVFGNKITNLTIRNNTISSAGATVLKTDTQGGTWHGNSFTGNTITLNNGAETYSISYGTYFDTMNNNIFRNTFSAELHGDFYSNLSSWQNATGFDRQSTLNM